MGDDLKLRVSETPRLEKATNKTKSDPPIMAARLRGKKCELEPVSATEGKWVAL